MSEGPTAAPAEGAPAPAAEAPAAPAIAPAAEGTALGTAPPAEAAPEGAPAAEAPTPEGEPPAETAPALTLESYSLKLPDGIAPDEATMGTFKEALLANSIPPEAAQSFMDMHVAELSKAAEAFAKSQADAWAETQKAWTEEIKADKVLGGSNTPAVTAALGRALDEYGTPEARQAFDLTGAGNNPAIVRMFYAMATALSEGQPHPAAGPSSQRGRNAADTLYPN